MLQFGTVMANPLEFPVITAYCNTCSVGSQEEAVYEGPLNGLESI